MLVLLLSSDLMLISQVGGAVRAVGAEFKSAAQGEALLESLTTDSLVLVDLATPGLAIDTLVPELRALTTPPRAILAFGQHVHAARLQAAADAGCDEVFSRGQFTSRSAEILARYV